MPPALEAGGSEDGAQLSSNNGGVVEDYLGRFRRAAAKQGLEVQVESKDFAFIELRGTWQDIGDRIVRLVADIYDLRPDERVQVSVIA